MGKERASGWASSLVHGLLSQGRQDGARVPFLRSLLCVSVVVRGGAGERGFPGWWVNQYRGIKNMAGEVWPSHMLRRSAEQQRWPAWVEGR